MKLRHLPTLCAALLALCSTLATAQTSAVPGFISYQGRVVDATGANVGAGTPVNRTVIFRIWDNPSSTATANLIYSEAQTVTVSEGEFSVLVGQGVENPTQTFSYSETTKKLTDFSTAFNGSARYLGVTVAAAATIATTDNEITPRQQIVSTAFAMRAKFAESIGSSSDLTINPVTGTASNYGLGWYGTGRLFGTTAVDGPVLFGQAGGALGSVNGLTKNIALQWNAAGQIGVGGATTFDTNNKLTLQGDDSASPARQFVIRGNTDTTKRLNIGFDTTGNQATLQSYTAASTAGNLLLNPSGGNVGVGTSSPLGKLTVNTGTSAFTIGNSDITTGAWLRNDGTNTVLSTNAGDMYFGYSGSSKTLHFMGGGTTDAMTIDSSRNITVPGTITATTITGTAVKVGAVNFSQSAGFFRMSQSANTLSITQDSVRDVMTVVGQVSPPAVGSGVKIFDKMTINKDLSAGGEQLEVAGNIKLGSTAQYSVPGAEENLRIIRGTVSSTGAVLYGSGFTVSKGPAGQYTVNFTTAFGVAPTVTVTANGASITDLSSSVFGLGAGVFSVGIVNRSIPQYSDQSFMFIAIGPR